MPGTRPEAGAEAAAAEELWPARGSIVRSSGAAREASLNDAPRGIAGSPDRLCPADFDRAVGHVASWQNWNSYVSHNVMNVLSYQVVMGGLVEIYSRV